MPLASPSVTLSIRAGPHTGESKTFDSYNTLVVGRGADANWRLGKDPFFSRYHFRIETNPPQCLVADLESSNGTLVNGKRITQVDLKQGDRITCGDTVFEVAIAQPRPVDPADAPRPERSPVASTIEYAVPGSRLRSVADFEIGRELGRGAMGVVYHAVHRMTGHEAAVKLIESQVAARPDAMRLFFREAQILSQLRHPRIVEYVSLGLHDGQMFVAMEYVPTIDVWTLIRSQSRPRQIRLACGLACYVLEALQYAHEHDIVHRDVKPSNLLVYKAGGKVHLKLADFGLAKNYFSAGLTNVSCENEVRGTLAYMAPEQVLDCRFAKPACDIYATGVCLYQLLCGRMPIEVEEDGSRSLVRLLNSSPAPLATVATDVPRELAGLVDRALAREPGDRFSSAEHMRKGLLKFLP